MPAIDDLLTPSCVDLDIAAGTLRDAVDVLLGRLNGDPRVKDFPVLRAAVLERAAPPSVEGASAVLIAHGRTPAVANLVLAAGRIPGGLPVGDGPARLELVFVAGIPAALASEYLRVVGVIARACRNPDDRAALLTVASAADFISVLSAVESRL